MNIRGASIAGLTAGVLLLAGCGGGDGEVEEPAETPAEGGETADEQEPVTLEFQE